MTAPNIKPALWNRMRAKYDCFYCCRIDACNPQDGCYRLKHGQKPPTKADLDALKLKPNL